MKNNLHRVNNQRVILIPSYITGTGESNMQRLEKMATFYPQENNKKNLRMVPTHSLFGMS